MNPPPLTQPPNTHQYATGIYYTSQTDKSTLSCDGLLDPFKNEVENVIFFLRFIQIIGAHNLKL